MNLTIVLFGFLLYWVLIRFLDSRGFLPRGVETVGPILLFKTARGKRWLDRLAKPKRLLHSYGNIGVFIAVLTMVGTFFMLLYSGYVGLVSPPEPSALTDPRNVLVIPGVNEFLPLSVAPELLGGLLIGLVVHEGGHGVMSRVEDVEVEGMGPAFLGFIPVGAFVEPNQDQVDQKSIGSRSRIYAAGITNNFVIAIISFIALALLMSAVIPTGGVGIAGVVQNSTADNLDIQRGDIIKTVEGKQIQNPQQYHDILQKTTGNISIEISTNGETKILNTYLPGGVRIRNTLDGYPAENTLQSGDLITGIDGEKIENTTAFQQYIQNKNPGETITITYLRNGQTNQDTIELAENPQRPNSPFLGVTFYTESQLVGVVPYNQNIPIGYLGSLNPIDWIASIYLPFGATGPQFSGFHGTTLGFYSLNGVPAMFGGIYWFILNLLYWTAWINFNVAVLNCIPLVPLDGGRIFKEMATGILTPITKKNKEKIANIATGAIAVLMLASIFLSILGPRILG